MKMLWTLPTQHVQLSSSEVALPLLYVVEELWTLGRPSTVVLQPELRITAFNSLVDRILPHLPELYQMLPPYSRPTAVVLSTVIANENFLLQTTIFSYCILYKHHFILVMLLLPSCYWRSYQIEADYIWSKIYYI